MNWIKINIITTSRGIDPVCYALEEAGINGVEISDKEDFAKFLEENRKYWDYVDESLESLKTADTKITAYAEDNEEGLSTLAEIEKRISALRQEDVRGEFGSLDIVTTPVKDEDWSENWKQYFVPTEIGSKVLIQPEWLPLEETADRVVFRVNPGLTFGTGTHDTTRFCIEAIEEFLKPGDTVLDLGCGSGILSIIALLLGASHCDAVDIDSKAVDVAYANLALNNLDRELYNVSCGDIIADDNVRKRFGKYDLVVANIVADVIIALAPYIMGFLKPGGKFICSGIINERAQEVAKALQAENLEIIEEKRSSEWIAYICR